VIFRRVGSRGRKQREEAEGGSRGEEAEGGSVMRIRLHRRRTRDTRGEREQGA